MKNLEVGYEYTTDEFFNNVTSLVITGENMYKFECDYYIGEEFHQSGEFRKIGDFRDSLYELDGDFNPNEYYMLFVPYGTAPTKKHYSLEKAQDECKRLMKSRNIDEVIILKKVGKATVPSLVDFEMDEE